MKELLQRCRAGDGQAIATLVGRFEARAVEFAAAFLHDEHLARDAVQEAFLGALRHLADLREPDAFWGWFRQIVRTQCNRTLRGRRETPVPDVGLAPEADPAAAHERAALDDAREAVRLAFERLAGVPREAAEMFYLDELPCAQIAERLGVPEGTVKRRLHDARRQLRILLADRRSVASCRREADWIDGSVCPRE